MYRKNLHIHFMGIGGIGMSGIAIVLKQQGYIVSGCDADLDQTSIRLLRELGCTVTQGHFSPACQDTSINMLVYSAAVRQDHPELAFAHARAIPVVSRAQLLAELMRRKMSIAVAGAHGKTTTSALISHILVQAQFQPTCIVGGHCKNFDTSAWAGTGDLLVAEADESDRSLAFLPATLAVITNIDREHLDAYKDLDDIVATFAQFVHNTPFFGKAIVCIDDPGVHKLLPLLKRSVITYGLSHKAQIHASALELRVDCSYAQVHAFGKELGKLYVPIAGQHHVLNALAALAVALEVGVTFVDIARAIATFKGVDRRFCYHGDFQGAQVFDDYAHHPREIACQLQVARKRAQKKLHVVFQPHRFTRTKFLWQEFIQTFAQVGIDSLVITDIFPASEPPIEGVTSQQLVADLNKQSVGLACYISLDDEFKLIKDHLAQVAHEGDLILLLGAGKVFKMVNDLISS